MHIPWARIMPAMTEKEAVSWEQTRKKGRLRWVMRYSLITSLTLALIYIVAWLIEWNLAFFWFPFWLIENGIVSFFLWSEREDQYVEYKLSTIMGDNAAAE